MSQDMEAVKRRILALMAKTTANGCSEAEAIAAAQKVQAMLHEHQLDLSDIELKRAEMKQTSYDTHHKKKTGLDSVVVSIAYFTDTKVWRDYDTHGVIQYVFFGMEHDVVIANYITSICDRAMVNGLLDFRDTPGYKWAKNRGNAALSFETGMALRISAKLNDMKAAQRKNDAATTGRDLVVVKMPIVQEAFDALGLNLTNAKASNQKLDDNAYRSGWEVGANVNINPGVSGAERAKVSHA